MRKRYILLIAMVLVLISYGYFNFVFEAELEGDYFYMNHEQAYRPPNKPDTLNILVDGTYHSKFYGSGKYSVFHTPRGTFINFKSDKPSDVFGQTYIKRGFSNQIRIFMGAEECCFYRKVN